MLASKHRGFSALFMPAHISLQCWGLKQVQAGTPELIIEAICPTFIKHRLEGGQAREDEQTYLYVFRWYFLSLIMWGARERMAIRRIFPALRIFSEGTWVLIRWEEKRGKESLRKGVDPVNS